MSSRLAEGRRERQYLGWRRLAWWGRLVLLLCMAAAVLGGQLGGAGATHRALAAPQPQGLGTDETRNVLLLNSYHAGLSWTDSIVAAVRAVIFDPVQNPLASGTELYVEYMDTKRVPMDDAVDARWRAYLAEKYAGIPLDLIIVSDNDAYNFLRRHATALFPQTRVVFCGVNFFKDEDLAIQEANGMILADRFTGVLEKVDFESTIQVALRLHPKTERIIVVNDITTTGQAVQQELEAVLPSFSDVTFEMLLNPTLADLGRLRGLPENTLVLLVLLNRDGDGRFYTYEQSIDLLLTQTDRPIYGVWDFYLGYGLMGGMLTNAGLQGQTAAEMAVLLLNGASVEAVPMVRVSPNRYMFDYEQLRRFGVPLSSLPSARQTAGLADTLVLNRPASFLQAYGTTVGVVLVVLAIFGGVVWLQRGNLEKQRAAAAALQEANFALTEARASMETQVALRTEDLERRSRQFRIAAAVAREVAGGVLVRQNAASGDVELELLLQRVVTLISEAFDFYHVGVFLVDEVGEYAVLRAASSPGGQAMAARGHRLRVGGPGRGSGQGIVGYVAGRGESRIALDVDRDEVWRETSELGETQSEMALPLKLQRSGVGRSGAWVIGVLDVQSRERGAFRHDDVEVLEIVTDQLALAIQTARLFEESRRAVDRLEQNYAERVLAPWQGAQAVRAYGFDGTAVRALGRSLATGSGEVAEIPVEPVRATRLEVPIPLRGEVVGTIVLERDIDARPWLPEERALAEAIGMQAGLSLESAQLLSESQVQAQRQRLLTDIASRMRETLDMDMILQTALREMGQGLGIASIEVRMHGGAHE